MGLHCLTAVGHGLSSRTGRQVASLGPLFPQSRARGQPIGAGTQGANFRPMQRSKGVWLFNHLIGACEKCRRDRNAERFRGGYVDDHFKFDRLLNRKTRRLRTLENGIDIDGCPPKHVGWNDSVRYESAILHEQSIWINAWDATPRHRCDNRLAMANRDWPR